MASLSIAMNCPRCGGDLSLTGDAEMLSCPYCTALLAIEGDEGVRQVALRSAITGDDAVKAVRDWWINGLIAYDVSRKSQITESYLIHVPFWKLRVMVTGWLCGQSNNDSINGKFVAVEKMVLEEREWNEIACDTGGIGALRLDDCKGDAVPYESGLFPVFDVTTSRTDAEARGLACIEEAAARDTGVKGVTFKRIDVIPRDLSIVFYPVWMVNYTYQDRMYSASIDGISGAVLYGRAPGSMMTRSFALAAGMGAAGFVPLLCIGFLIAVYQHGQLSGNDTTRWGAMFTYGLVGSFLIIAFCIIIAFKSYAFFKSDPEMTIEELTGGKADSGQRGAAADASGATGGK